MKYGEFLLKLTQRTKLKPAQLHKSLLNALKETYHGNTNYLNELTLANLVLTSKSVLKSVMPRVFAIRL